MSGKKSRPIFYTPIKRTHLVGMSGVGSIIRTRNGITALVADLGRWSRNVPVDSNLVGIDRDVARDNFLRNLAIRDPELEAACNVPRFVSPQPAPDEPSRFRDWLIPSVRFPLSGACVNPFCQRLFVSLTDNPNAEYCPHCVEQQGRRLRRNRVQQLTVFKVCFDGHLDEIDFAEEAHRGCQHGCLSLDMVQKYSGSVRRPVFQCLICGCKSSPDNYEGPCTGARPWVPEGGVETCTQTMHVVERTSVQAYFPRIKSAIFMPFGDEFDETIVMWLLTRGNIDEIDVASERNMSMLVEAAARVNLRVSLEEIERHVRHLQSERDDEPRVEWDPSAARGRELDVLTTEGINQLPRRPSLLEHQRVAIGHLSPTRFGNRGLISGVVAVTKLTETRIQDGFSRYRPADGFSSWEGQRRMWGFAADRYDWLPGVRGYGEGILFELNPAVVSAWSVRCQTTNPEKYGLGGPRETLVHTLAHLVMAEAALRCGYPIAGIRDRIYDLPDGRLAFLVYVAEADSAGTLGGLVELAFGERLESLVASALESSRWCAQDPVCISSSTFQVDHQVGACHQCVLLPETSCEWFNAGLDRGSIIGNDERRLPGILASL